jgi:ABC-type transport system substrate-binding protein
MKKVVVLISGVAVLVLAAVGCTPKAAAPATIESVTGTITSINTPAEPGPDQVTIQTPQGPQTFDITTNTDVSYNNTACAIENAGKIVTQNGTTFTCTIVYDPTYQAIAAGVYIQAP